MCSDPPWCENPRAELEARFWVQNRGTTAQDEAISLQLIPLDFSNLRQAWIRRPNRAMWL